MATSSDLDVSFAGELVLRLAGLAYLARFCVVSRPHTTSELRLCLYWCTEHLLTRDTAYHVL